MAELQDVYDQKTIDANKAEVFAKNQDKSYVWYLDDSVSKMEEAKKTAKNAKLELIEAKEAMEAAEYQLKLIKKRVSKGFALENDVKKYQLEISKEKIYESDSIEKIYGQFPQLGGKILKELDN